MLSSIHLDPKRNSIRIIRHILAIAVIVSHAYPLGGFEQEPLKQLSQGRYGMGSLAVDAFFVLSGYLITASFLRTKSLPVFLWHRALRIFPAYWVCIAVTAIAVPLLFGSTPDLGYLFKNLLSPVLSIIQSLAGALLPMLLNTLPDWDVMAQNIPFLQGQISLGDILKNNPYSQDINASLWTLNHELRLYCWIGILGAIGLLQKRTILILLPLIWLGYLGCEFLLDIPGLSDTFKTSTHFLIGSLFGFVA
jgi:peptidoglycan/LPS O-acetylase OafA/YrhL